MKIAPFQQKKKIQKTRFGKSELNIINLKFFK